MAGRRSLRRSRLCRYSGRERSAPSRCGAVSWFTSCCLAARGRGARARLRHPQGGAGRWQRRVQVPGQVRGRVRGRAGERGQGARAHRGHAVRRLVLAVSAALAGSLVLAANASAHGLAGRADLPIPEWLFGWGAAMVLVVSFVGLAVLWPEPRLQTPGWRPLPGRVGRVLASRPVEIVCGVIGVFLLGLVIYAGLRGTQSTTANFAPTLIYVIFWLGLVPLSVLFGDVFRAFNPWRAIGRAVAWVARTVSRGELPAPLEYPAWLGRWPAATGIFCFATIELVASNGDKPETLAIAALVYSALSFVAMALYGVERWIERGE